MSRFGSFLGPPISGASNLMIWIRVILVVVYTLCYFYMSIWAIRIWARDLPHTPKVSDDLAIISMGLFLAIVVATFNSTDES